MYTWLLLFHVVDPRRHDWERGRTRVAPESTERRLFVFPAGPAEVRRLVRTVLEHGEPRGLAAFRAEATRLRVLCRGERTPTLRFAHDLGVALTRVLRTEGCVRCVVARQVRAPADARAYVRALHLPSPLGPARDPWSEASSLPDMLGIRTIAPWLPPRARAIEPDWRPGRALRDLGLRPYRPVFEPDLLAESAAAAACVPALGGKQPECVAARAAAVQYAADLVGIERAGMLVGASRAAGYRLAAMTLDAAQPRAVGLQMALRTSHRPHRRRRRRGSIR